MDIALIGAIQKKDRGLGFKNDLLYKLADDMHRFRELTKGAAVIMGRKTWESLPANFRPLPNRDNIVITRDTSYEAPRAKVAHSMEEALELAKNSVMKTKDCAFIIGGGEIYTMGLPFANRLYLTIVEGDKEADAFFPDYSDFTKIIEQKKMVDESTGVNFEYLTLEK